MRNSTSKIIALAFMISLAGMLISTGPVFACSEQVKETELLLEETKERAAKGEKSKKADRWLKESGASLARLKKECDKANSFFKRAWVGTKLTGIRTKIASAGALIGGGEEDETPGEDQSDGNL